MADRENIFADMEREIAMFVRRAEAARIARLNYKDFDRSTYLLLSYLEERGPLGIKALADACQLDISTASRQTAALEAKGYVERQSDPRDARVNLLRLKPQVPGLLREIREARAQFYAELLGDWSLEDARAFADLLGKFNHTTAKKLQPKQGEPENAG